MQSGMGEDWLSGNYRLVPETDFNIAGFHCGNFSNLCTDSQSFADCIALQRGDSGKTFAFMQWYMDNMKSDKLKFWLLENVEHFSRGKPLQQAQAAMAARGFQLPRWGIFAARNYSSDNNARQRFYGPFARNTIAVDPAMWDAACAAMQFRQGETVPLSAHILPVAAVEWHPWLTHEQMRRGKRPRFAKSEHAKAMKLYQGMGMEYDMQRGAPFLETLSMASFPDMPASTFLKLDLYDRRQRELLWWKVNQEKILCQAIEQKGVKLLPLEKSWEFFNDIPVNKAPTLCGSSSHLVCDFTHDKGPQMRPQLPEEGLSIQGAPAGDMWPNQSDFPAWLMSLGITYAEMNHMIGMSFHINSFIAALLATLLTLDRLD